MTTEKRPRVRRHQAHWCLIALVVVASGIVRVSAGQGPAGASAPDARVGLAPGLRDAGVAARNLTLLASVPKADGFFDPNVPDAAYGPTAGARGGGQGAARTGGPGPLTFANSDLAFSATTLFQGNFNGFTVYSVEDPAKPQLRAAVVCPGGQGDVSVYGHLLFMSVEETRGRIDCGTGGAAGAVNAERFRGIRIFDISDVRAPRQVAAVQTCRGSHTHTLITRPDEPGHVYLYGSGSAGVRPVEELAGCSNKTPQEDRETSLYSIDVIEVPVATPEQARIVNRPRLFADAETGTIAGLWKGGSHGEGTQQTSATNHCHDITAFPAVGLAAGACAGNGVLIDISDPVRPVRIDQVSDPNFAYWHSATFNQDGTKVIFSDEWGGGTSPRCRATDPQTWGADAIFEIRNRTLQFGAYYKMPAVQTDRENCVAHNGSIVPVPGRDIMVQGWYQGGLSVFDFTDAAHPFEVAYFDRGPVNPDRLAVGGYWSAYWYNGHIYASEMVRGLDILQLQPSDLLSQHEIDAATLVKWTELNVQQQTRLTWPAVPVVARAYVDQLRRAGVLSVGRLQQLSATLDRIDMAGTTGRRPDEPLRLAAGRLARDLARDAEGAVPRDAARLTALAQVFTSASGVPPATAVHVPVRARQNPLPPVGGAAR